MAISKRARAIRRMLPLFIAPENASLERQRGHLERAGKVPRPRDYTYYDVVIGGIPGIRSEPKKRHANRHILFLHGGGYMLGSAASHTGIAARLAVKARAAVTTINYRLAPEHRFPAAIDDSVAAAKAIIDEFGAGNVAIVGDSAGGGATIATMCALRDEGHAVASCAFVMSPWTDLTASGKSMRTKADIDPMITDALLQSCADSYLGDTAADNPKASPLFADLTGLAPLLIHVGAHEMLLNDSTRLAESAFNARVNVEIKVWPEMWHVFQAFVGFMPEANLSMQEGADFIIRHTA